MLKSFYDRLIEGGLDSVRSWLIAAGSCIIYVLCYGITRANGVLFKVLLSDGRNLTREDAAWPFSVAGACVIYGAPVAGVLEFRFGSKATTILGITLHALGSFICYFSTDIIFLTIFFGLIRGTGQAVATVFAPGLINRNFKRHLGAAMGIATTGTPLGGLVLPLLMQYCLEQYELPINFLIMGGMSLSAVFGALIIFDQKLSPVGSEQESTNSGRTEQGLANAGFEDETSVSTMSKIKYNTKEDAIVTISENVLLKDYGAVKRRSIGEEILYAKIKTSTEQNSTSEDHSKCESNTLQPVNADCSLQKKPVLQAVKEILKSRGFYVIMLINISSSLTIGLYALVIVDYAEDKGIGLQLSIHLLAVCSGAEMVGRIILGWISDRNYIGPLAFVTLSLFVSSAVVLWTPYMTKYSELMCSAVLIGLSQGSAHNIMNVIFLLYISKDNMHLAVSFVRSIAGLSHLPRSAIVGFFRDSLGSYDHLFHSLAGLLIFSTSICTAEEIYRRILIRKEKRKTEIK